MLTVVVLGGFGLVLLVTACIVADVIAGRARRSPGRESTIGVVTRVRGPLHGQLDSGASGEYVEVTAEYYTRHGEGPFEVQRRLPVTARALYAKGDRVAVSYDVRFPRRGQLTGRIPTIA
jgi:hypothetical protein